MRARLGSLLLVLGLVALATGACTSWRLARLDALSVGEPFAGPPGGYTLTPPSDAWVRTPDKEGERIDLALARKSNDAWLNVSVLPDRFPSADLALEHARAQADALMQTEFRDERDATVPSPEGDLHARVGIYCGTFDRELRSRENCFVMLATVRAGVTWALVGQARVEKDGTGRRDELEKLVRSLRIVDPDAAREEEPAAAGAPPAEDGERDDG